MALARRRRKTDSNNSNSNNIFNPLLLMLPVVPPLTFCQDRLYLAAYTAVPTEETYFPYPESPAPLRSPTKRGQRSAVAAERLQQAPPSAPRKVPAYFTVDDQLFYNAFHHDFGPFHIGHLYRFALYFHDILGAKENKDRPIVFWSRADPRSELTQGPLASVSARWKGR